ncbi:hypothetical protein S40288_02672 [Stachybotrys chartarum IBT 40288]|nr:hypothetical protein S40288_02672 [Stachybotrys chartarum IBT 40288]
MNSNNDTSEVIVASVALVISVVALAATFMQVLQQYYASARGYSQCNEKVMGGWASTKSRNFSLEELRFEVEFDAPVIFVSPPNNTKGPIPNANIYYLDGTKQSLDDTWTVDKMDLRKDYEDMSNKERIHTADNERASWFVLLYAIQRMEATSAEWQKAQYSACGPPNHFSDGLPRTPPTLHKHHTMTVAVQRKRKSWDTMPSTITRPYATTTMCHLIEMMAALGVYWKEFDRKYDRYRAEGNGFMVLGERISELGLMFSFQVYGQCHFEKNRVIPVDEVKELCFGYVPTIYRKTKDRRRLESPVDEARTLAYLQMATRDEIAETLVSIGCNNNAVRHYRNENSRTSHLFSLAFEIVGMLSRNLHIEHSSFTYIPNPTPDRWDKRSVSMSKLLQSYGFRFETEIPGIHRNPVIVRRLRSHIDSIINLHEEETFGGPVQRLLLLEALHTALDDADEILTAKRKEEDGTESQDPLDKPKRPPAPLRDLPTAELILREKPETLRQRQRREVVQDVLRSHLQEVLRQLNDRDDRSSDNQSLHVPDVNPPSPGGYRFPDQPRGLAPRFEDINEASPDERQDRFMDVYFEVIRPRVVRGAKDSTKRRASIASAPPGAPPGFGLKKSGTGRTHASEPIPEETSRGAHRTFNGAVGFDDSDDEYVMEEGGEINTKEKHVSLADEDDVKHDDIWCVLVFRMICWLMLHDFNKSDVQVSKSELLGSRMPVYVA